ncbi:Uncharacterised protein [Mycobacteroides abscessus subsp. abscessus]|nr:Uncharacterised protein [Mycobacteroides abscessus subsp. abscessus]
MLGFPSGYRCSRSLCDLLTTTAPSEYPTMVIGWFPAVTTSSLRLVRPSATDVLNVGAVRPLTGQMAPGYETGW